MESIDLEKKMISGNRYMGKNKQMVLDEYTRLKKQGPNTLDVLASVGLEHNIKTGKDIEESIAHLEKYNQERIFHEKQIRKICMRYDLRFLQAKLYKGTVDNLLAGRIQQFKEHYNYKPENKESCYYIVAPKQSFNLQVAPKDPLFFAKIDEEHYYLIHKWGTDLSGWRRVQSFFNTCRYGMGGTSAPLGLIPLLAVCVLGLYGASAVFQAFTKSSNIILFADGTVHTSALIQGSIILAFLLLPLIGRGIKADNYRSENI